MFKIIRRLLLLLLVAVIALAGLQWRSYQKQMTCRDNALLYFQEKDYEKAIHYLQEGLGEMTLIHTSIEEDMSCYLAESYYQLGQYEKAIEIYDAFLLKKPSNHKYYLLKGEVYEAMGNNELAVKIYEEGWKNTEDISFLTKICDSYLMAKEYDKALEYAKKGAELEDDSAAQFLFKEIIIYEKQQNYEAAYEAAEAYCQLHPEDKTGQKELKFLTTRISAK